MAPRRSGSPGVAQALAERLGVQHVDVDALVLELLAAGVRPDPAVGWLAWVEQRVAAALHSHLLVSVEATGAWDSDWRLADDLQARGVRVQRVWVSAPEDVGASLVADLPAAAAEQPPHSRLDHPAVAAQPLAGLDAAPGDPG
jgi:hypothetical protein